VNASQSSNPVPVMMTRAEKKKLQWAQERGQNFNTSNNYSFLAWLIMTALWQLAVSR